MKVDIVHVVVGRPVLELDLEAARCLERLLLSAPLDASIALHARLTNTVRDLAQELDTIEGSAVR